MSARDDILTRIRACQPAPTPMPEVPTFDADAGPASLLDRFKAGVVRMGGKVVEAGGPLADLVRELHPQATIVASGTPEVAGNREIHAQTHPASLADVDLGVVRARFGVGETGSVWVTDADFGVSALGFLSQHLVVLLDPADIVSNMHQAYRRSAEFDASYGVFMTGPSATADIEGVLIHGAQGIRSLTVVIRSRSRGVG
jgi:L-lactate dehydrogenase complex protein LldG